MKDARLAPLLDRLGLFFAVFGVMLRWLVSGAAAGTGLNLFIHLLFWVSLAAWFAARALEGGATWRFTGIEFALLGFAIACLISVQRAGYKLPALDAAMAYLSYALLFVLVVQAFGRDTLLSLFSATSFTVGFYAIVQCVLIFPLLRQTPEAIQRGAISKEFVWRLHSSEVFATFLYPNVFAGFLVLVIPLLVGMLLDARRRGTWTKLAALGACVPSLILTGALGAWAALGAGAAAFVALALTRSRGRSWAVGGGAAVAVVLAVLVFGPLLPAIAARSHSMHNRQAYWQGAVRTFACAPLFGVGLDNFQDAYPTHKPETQQETRKVHNDYLQILAETGLAGLLAFGALLALGLRRAVSPETSPAPHPAAPPPWLIPVAAAAAFLFAQAWKGVFDVPATGGSAFFTLVLMCAWIGFYEMERRTRAEAADSTFTRIGAAAGLIAILAHMCVDFDFYEMGVAMALFLALALATILQGRADEVRLPRPVCAGAAAILFLLAFPLLAFVTPLALSADGEVEQARRALDAYLADRNEGRPGKTIALSDAIRFSQSAQQHNPFDPEGYELHARAELFSWELRCRAARKGDEPTILDLQKSEEIVLHAIGNAQALRPATGSYHADEAYFRRLFRVFHLKIAADLGRKGDLYRAKAHDHLRRAIEAQRRALALYPTLCANHYTLARLLELDGSAADAVNHYAEALRLNDMAKREPEDTERLQLEPLAQARCLKRTGRPFDGHGVLKTYFRKMLAGLDPGMTRQRIETLRPRIALLDTVPGESDDAMRPEIEDALNALLLEIDKPLEEKKP